MVAMAKRKPTTDSKPKRPGKRQIGLYIDERLYLAFERYIDSKEPKASITAHLELALREYLGKHGHWPPPSDA